MQIVERYKCETCGECYLAGYQALECEMRHKQADLARALLNEGFDLETINFIAKIWDEIPESLKNVNKDTLFKIPHLQCCEDFIYKIVAIDVSSQELTVASSMGNPYQSSESLHSLESYEQKKYEHKKGEE